MIAAASRAMSAIVHGSGSVQTVPADTAVVEGHVAVEALEVGPSGTGATTAPTPPPPVSQSSSSPLPNSS